MFVPAQWRDPGDGTTSTPGTRTFGEFGLTGADSAPSLSFPLAVVGPKSLLWPDLSIARDCGPVKCRFWSRDGRKFCSVLMDGFEWTLTNKLGQGESLKTNSLKIHTVWDFNAFRISESYTKHSEITSFKMCSCCICLGRPNQFIHLFLCLSENFTPSLGGTRINLSERFCVLGYPTLY